MKGQNKKNIKFRVAGYFGTGDPATVENLTSQAAWKRLAKVAGAVTNVRRYRDKKQALEGEGKRKDDRGDEYSIKQPAIGVTYTNKYSDSHNTATNWTATPADQQQYLDDSALRFRGTTKALYFDNSTPNNPVTFQSAGFTIRQDGSFSLQLYLYEPDSDAGQDVKAFMWGSQGSLGIPEWRFEIRNGNLSLMRLTPDWTAAYQAFYDALLNVEGALEDTQQAQKDTTERLIYAQIDSLSLGLGSKSVYGNPLEFTFRPESRGLYEITNEGSDAGANGTERFDTVENTAITRTRATGIMFHQSLMTVTNSGGAMMWQVGFPEFARSGQFRLPAWQSVYAIPLADRVFATNAIVPSGCTLTIWLDEPDPLSYQIVVDYTTDTLDTPLLYTASFTAQGGQRFGSQDTFWTSADFESQYESIIMEAKFQTEGSGKPMTASLSVRNDNGQVAGPSPSATGSILSGYETGLRAFHDRLCDIYVEEVDSDGNVLESLLVMGNCLITQAQIGSMAEAVQDENMNLVVRSISTVEFDISDQQVLLDEDLMQADELIGDGVTLGLHVLRHLQNFHALNAEMAGVSASTGRVLPSAPPGEAPVIRADNDSRGGHLHPLIERYGNGLSLDHLAGVWTLAEPSTSILEINHLPLTFSTNPSANQYPIYGDLDYLRDFSDFYNDFYIEGAEQWDGSRIRGRWTNYGSISNRFALDYVGRIKAYPDVQSDDLRSADDVQWVLRSLVTKHGKAGRFFNFPTVFIKELLLVQQPRVIIHSATFGDLIGEITRIGSASIKENKMALTMRELI